MAEYEFLTNHAQVLLCVAHDPGIRVRDIADTVGITERSAHRIVAQLAEDGYIARERVGRRNVYKVNPERPLHRPLAQETEQRRMAIRSSSFSATTDGVPLDVSPERMS